MCDEEKLILYSPIHEVLFQKICAFDTNSLFLLRRNIDVYLVSRPWYVPRWSYYSWGRGICHWSQLSCCVVLWRSDWDPYTASRTGSKWSWRCTRLFGRSRQWPFYRWCPCPNRPGNNRLVRCPSCRMIFSSDLLPSSSTIPSFTQFSWKANVCVFLSHPDCFFSQRHLYAFGKPRRAKIYVRVSYSPLSISINLMK